MKEQVLTEGQIAALRLIRAQGVGPITFFKLIKRYGTAVAAVQALECSSEKFKPAPLKAIEAECKKMAKIGARFLFFTEKDYPQALKVIADPPPVLTLLGDSSLLKNSIALVGARNASMNGLKTAQNLAQDLTQEGYTITSGLARGIDAAAHKGALMGGGKTVAVLGGGLDHIYPTENTNLFHQIAAQGVIIAETPLGTRPTAQSFPRRNRIVAGLSAGVVVVEATRHSGSLITAQCAGEQGREVMAVPGHPSDPRSAGANHLLRQGACLVQSAEDIIEAVQGFTHTSPSSKEATLYTREEQFDMPLSFEENIFEEGSTEEEKQVNIPTEGHTLGSVKDSAEECIEERLLKLIDNRTRVDDLVVAIADGKNGVESTVFAALSELELDGKIERLSGGYVARIK